MSSRGERFADHELVQRLDGGGAVEFHEARSLWAPHATHLLIRFPPNEQRWPPWAWPDVAKYIVHPNVLQMFELLTVGDRSAAVLEFVPGVDLRELIQQQRLSPGLACFIMKEVCQGLAAGLSAHTPGGPLQATLGTLSSDSPGPGVDVFQAGAILQQLLTGTPLDITARTPLEYVLALRHHPGRSFLKRHLPISSPLAAVLGKMLARDPQERFREASEAVAALSVVPELHGVQATARGDLAALVVALEQRALRLEPPKG